MLRGQSYIICIYLIITGLAFMGCEEKTIPRNTAPKATLLSDPPKGDTTSIFLLFGQGSSDAEDAPSWLNFRWNVDGDTLWDTEYSHWSYKVMRFPEPGNHCVVLEVKDRFGLTDTVSIVVETWGKNPDSGKFTDPRDGQSYRTIKFGNTWWMAENLNYGTPIRDTQLCADNGIAEKYCYLNDAEEKPEFGGYYTYYSWEELMDYDTLAITGLCPPGWMIPSKNDWEHLLDSLSYRGRFKYLTSGGFSGFRLTLSGIHELTKVWNKDSANPDLTNWVYFTRDYSKEPYGGKYQPCPYIAGSRSGISLLRFQSASVKLHKAAVPVRCIRYENN